MVTTNSRSSVLSKTNENPRNRSLLQYPSDFDASSGHWVLFSVYDYSRENIDSNFTPVASGATIALPIPNNLDTSYNADWDNIEIGTYVSPQIQLAQGIQKNGVNGVLEQIQNMSLTDLGSAAKKGATAAMLDATLTTQPAQTIMASIGYARNPFVSAAFRNVSFRSFNFQYKIMAESFEESETIFEIIKNFKMAMHPSYESVGDIKNALFKYPSIFRIRFLNDDYLFKIGTCILRECSVSYHAEGTPIYFSKNGKKLPTSINLSLTFSEVEVNTKQTIEAGR